MPILVVLYSNQTKTNKPFNFENWWLLEQDFQQAAKTSWQHSTQRPFTKKPNFLPLISKYGENPSQNSRTSQKQSNNNKPTHHTSRTNQSKENSHTNMTLSLPNKTSSTDKDTKNIGLPKGTETLLFPPNHPQKNQTQRITHLHYLDGTISTTPQQLAVTVNDYQYLHIPKSHSTA